MLSSLKEEFDLNSRMEGMEKPSKPIASLARLVQSSRRKGC